MWLWTIALAGGTTRVALPAGTDTAGWSDAAVRTGVELAASEPDVLVTATPGAWILRVVPAGPQAQVAPPRSAAEREAVLILADSLARPVGTAAHPLVVSGPPPEPRSPAVVATQPAARSATTTAPTPAGTTRAAKSAATPRTTAPAQTASSDTPPVTTPVTTPVAPVTTEARAFTPVTPPVTTPVTTRVPPVTTEARAFTPVTTPVTTTVVLTPVAPPVTPPVTTSVTTDTAASTPVAPPVTTPVTTPTAAPTVTPAPNVSEDISHVSAPEHPARYYPAVSVGVGVRLDGGPAANVRASVGRAFSPALRAQLELGYTSPSTLPAPILDGTVSSAHGGLALEVGERWFGHVGAAATVGWFAQDGQDRGWEIWPTLEVAAGHALPIGPLVLAPDIGLRADLARATLTVDGDPAAALSPLWIEARLTVRPR